MGFKINIGSQKNLSIKPENFEVRSRALLSCNSLNSNICPCLIPCVLSAHFMQVLGIRHGRHEHTQSDAKTGSMLGHGLGIESVEGSFDWIVDYPQLEKHLTCESLGVDKSARILQVGCGTSELSQHIYDAGFHNITNVDIHAPTIEVCSIRTHARSLAQTNCGTCNVDSRFLLQRLRGGLIFRPWTLNPEWGNLLFRAALQCL